MEFLRNHYNSWRLNFFMVFVDAPLTLHSDFTFSTKTNFERVNLLTELNTDTFTKYVPKNKPKKTLQSTKIGPTNSNDCTKYRNIYIPTLFPPFTLPAIHMCFNKNLKNHKQRNQIRTRYDIKLSKSTLN